MNESKDKLYIEESTVFGKLRVAFKTDGIDDKNSKCSLFFMNLGGCYPFEIETGTSYVNGFESVEVIFNGGGERYSLLECLMKIVEKAKDDGLIEKPDLEKENQRLKNVIYDMKDEFESMHKQYIRNKKLEELKAIRDA